MKIAITDMDHMGKGIGKIDNKIIFVPKSIPGDFLDIEIYKSFPKYDIGRINHIITKSNDRVLPECPYYDICGGCNISILPYEKQLAFKENKVKNIFKKYLNIDINPKIIPSNNIYHYRNKITFHNDNNLGLVSEFDNVIKIDRCLLVSDKINELYNLIQKENTKSVKKITIREYDDGLVLDITGNMKIDSLKDYCLAIYINNTCKYYQEPGYITIGNLKYKVSNKSFFQINTTNISNLYDEIVRLGEFNKNDIVTDLYCGVGSITLYVAKHVKSILGIEIIEDAIKDAKENALINNITNTNFIHKDVSKITSETITGNTIIVDPPRIGLDKHTIKLLNESNISKIVYVSCDPMTLVRDIKLLDNYAISGISIVDMFPQTHHIESICILERR